MKTQVKRWTRGATALLLSLLVVGGGLLVTKLAFAEDVEVTAGGDVGVIEAQSYSEGPVAIVTKNGTDNEYTELKTALAFWENADTGDSTLTIMRPLTSADLAGIKTDEGVITLTFDNYTSGVKKTLDLNGKELDASIVVQTRCASVGGENGYAPLDFVLSSGTIKGSLTITNVDWYDTSDGGGVKVTLANEANVNGGVSIPETNYYADSYSSYGYKNSLTMETKCGTIGGVYIGKKSTFTMHDGTIKNGEDGKITELSGRGVYLDQYATFTMDNGRITGNTTTESGGGVFAASNAVITMAADATISNNSAANGGGVFAEGPQYNSDDDPRTNTLTMTGGAITGNTATGGGGGVYVKGDRTDTKTYAGTLSVTNGVISNNSAAIGGGVYVNTWGYFTMSESTISGNTATGTGNGGGVFVADNAVFTMQNGTIGGENAQISAQDDEVDEGEEDQSVGNQATNGGGVYVAAAGQFLMQGGAISNNTATNGGGVYALGANYSEYFDRSMAFSMTGGTITKNEASGNGGGVWFSGGGMSGTAYYGKFIMGPGTISDNTAANGGGVYVANGQFVLMEDTISIISGNKAEAAATNEASTNALTGQAEPSATGGNGGGVYVAGAANTEATGGEFYMSGVGTINSNTATTNGGGVYVAGGAIDKAPGGLLVMKGTIGGTTTDADGKVQSAGNTATDGGGVYVAGGATAQAEGGRFVMGAPGDNITNNTATGNGGGVYLAGGATDSALTKCAGQFTMSAGTITSNTATTKGGGVYVAEDQTLTIFGKLNITENTVDGKANNVHLHQARSNTVNEMKVEDDLEDSQIGVTTEFAPTPEKPKITITTGYERGPNQSVDPAKYFINDVKASEDGVQKYFVCWVSGHTVSDSKEAALQVHVHNWTYTAKEEEDTLTATCDATGAEAIHGACVKAPAEGQDVVTLTRTLSVPAATKTYDGKAVIATLSEEKLWTETNGLVEPKISYYKDGQDEPLPGAPKDVGSYIAKATVTQDGQQDAVAQVAFTINPLEAKLNWTTTLTYNGKEQQPPVTVSNLVKGDSCSVTVTGEQTKAGTHQATATKLSNENYKLPADPTTQFTIAPLEAKLAWANTSFVYDGKGHMPTATVSNLVKGDTCAVAVTGEQTKAGTHTATATKLSNENYKLPADPTTQFTIASTGVSYSAHVQTYGNRGPVTSGPAGTLGESKRLEALTATIAKGSIEYRSHVQGKGWENTWAKDGGVSGTMGESRRVEAIQMKISGAEGQHVWYRVHSQTYGWLGWAKDGEPAGTAGQSKRVEAYEVGVLPDGQTPDGYDANVPAFRGTAQGRSHVQGIGWQRVGSVGFTGTTGQSRRVEAMSLSVPAALTDVYAGGIEYQVHVQGIGWQGYRQDGATAGTLGKRRRVEAVQVRLTGDLANHFSVWYRVHSQTFGWSGWARDDDPAGSAGYRKRVEAVEVVILPKTAAAPGSTANAYRSK